MKKPVLYLFVLFLLSSATRAQKIAPADLRLLSKKQDSLKTYAKDLAIDSFSNNRMRSDSFFVKVLRRSLDIKNSFYYPFDSVRGIGKVYAPDSTFRIITWSMFYNEDICQQRGVIQFRPQGGVSKWVPLLDYSSLTPYPEDSVRDFRHWIGAIYYNIIETKFNNKDYYTLFGYDPNSMRSNKKWIEVLTFDEHKMPVFGGKYFSFEKDSVQRPAQDRFGIEYKKDASTTVNFDPDLNLILVDHLVSESDEPDLPYTLVPDGDYEGFKWVNGKWLHVDKVFDQKLEDGQAPIPDPIRDLKGNTNEEKLEQQSEKNKAARKGRGE